MYQGFFVPAPLGARDTMCAKNWPNKVAALRLVLQVFRFHLFAQFICMYLDSKYGEYLWAQLKAEQGLIVFSY